MYKVHRSRLVLFYPYSNKLNNVICFFLIRYRCLEQHARQSNWISKNILHEPWSFWKNQYCSLSKHWDSLSSMATNRKSERTPKKLYNILLYFTLQRSFSTVKHLVSISQKVITKFWSDSWRLFTQAADGVIDRKRWVTFLISRKELWCCSVWSSKKELGLISGETVRQCQKNIKVNF